MRCELAIDSSLFGWLGTQVSLLVVSGRAHEGYRFAPPLCDLDVRPME